MAYFACGQVLVCFLVMVSTTGSVLGSWTPRNDMQGTKTITQALLSTQKLQTSPPPFTRMVKRDVSTGDISTRIPRTAIEPGVLISRPTTVHPTRMVKLEAFLDLNCPVSYAAYNDILLPLAEHYANESKLVIKAHMFPLPYHRNAMLCTQGVFVIEHLKPAKVLDYIGAVLAQWEPLGVMTTRDDTEYDVLRQITSIAVQSTGVDPVEFESEIDGYREHCKKVFKYGAKRGVAGTPTFFLNGMEMSGSDSDTLEQWINYIDDTIVSIDQSLIEY